MEPREDRKEVLLDIIVVNVRLPEEAKGCDLIFQLGWLRSQKPTKIKRTWT